MELYQFKTVEISNEGVRLTKFIFEFDKKLFE